MLLNNLVADPVGNFVEDRGYSKRGVKEDGVFFQPSPHIWQGLRGLLTLSKDKKRVGSFEYDS
jgi:hypothetical protein